MKKFESGKYTNYYVTEEGQVFSQSSYHSSGELKEKKLYKHRRGYIYVRTVCGNRQVHRLVATAFIPNHQNKSFVNHKDCNKHNNHVSNLEWVTAKENTVHAIKNGKIKPFKKNEGNNIKYTNEQCAEAIRLVESGMTYKSAGNMLGMPYSTVAHLIRGSRREITT